MVSSGSGYCTIVQNNATGSAVTNEARCVQWTSTNPATQNCNITQTNVHGTNRAFVVQVVTQSQPDGEQTATQNATVHQSNLAGANESAVTQTIGQHESKFVGGATAATQTQEGHQYIEVCQGAAVNPCFAPSSGTNKSGVNQNHVQLASVQFDDGAAGAISQNQNATTGPKSSSYVRQNTSDKTNEAALLQFSRQTGTVHNRRTDDEDDGPSARVGFNGTVFQQQGHNVSCSADGLCGFQFQTSTGVQRAFERQDEVQRLVAPPGAAQTQFGPEFCCATQTGGNNGSVNKISQSKAQFHTSSLTEGTIQGHCDSPSPDLNNCDVTQTLTQNGTTTSNACSGASCNTVISCTQGGEGSRLCTPYAGDGTPTPVCPGGPCPVPPCVEGCVITFVPMRVPSFLAVLPDESSLTG
ncbi:MAG: hypothetical protein M3R54_08655 [Chloroflexota bacterium]|nr:hypothetical protein [Chloroflexota bacterium]